MLSSRKHQIIVVVRESMEKGVWYPCLQNLDNVSDWNMFVTLALLATIISPWQGDVLDHSFLLPNFTQLKRWFHRSGCTATWGGRGGGALFFILGGFTMAIFVVFRCFFRCDFRSALWHQCNTILK